MKSLSGKAAIVTGASKGIGAGIAKRMAAEGACVTVNYSSSKQDAERVVAEIAELGGKGIAVRADMSKRDEISALFAEAKKAYGRLDILVNNAGIYEFAALEEITEHHFRRMFDLNVLGLIYCCQESLKYFGAEGGSIINISSIASSHTPPSTSVYSATKAAVDAVTKVLAKELGRRKIRVNSINPGMVKTEGTRGAGIIGSDWSKQAEAATPLGRLGEPEDIAPVAVFLASADSRWVTGDSIAVAGGNN